MPCPHCHRPGLIDQLKLAYRDWERRYPQWSLVWICLSPECVYEFKPVDGGARVKGRPRFALPLGNGSGIVSA
jgi:hypothetical protein